MTRVEGWGSLSDENFRQGVGTRHGIERMAGAPPRLARRREETVTTATNFKVPGDFGVNGLLSLIHI